MSSKKIKKIFLTLAIVFEFSALIFSPLAASAGINIPSIANSFAQTLESRYHVSLDSIKSQGENFNVSDNKISPPQVSLSFSPSEPKEGQALTARAVSSFFQNPKEKLYYTWYIKHDNNDNGKHGRKECEKKEYNKNCDWNDDNKINEEDWKIEAMRLIANSGYNNKLDEPLPDYGKDGDDDEYQAIMGGDDKKSMPKYCYVHDFKKGVSCEIVDEETNHNQICEHLFPDTNGRGEVGDNDFKHDEEEFWGTNPQDSSTAGNGNLDEANIAGLGQDSFNWIYFPGDQVGVAIEGTSIIPTKHDNSSYMIMWALPKNDFTCSSSVGSRSLVECPAGYTARCTETDLDFSIAGGASTYEEKCKDIISSPYCSEGVPICGVGIPKCIPNGELKSNDYYDKTDFSFVDLDNDGSNCQASAILTGNYTSCEKLRFRDCQDTPTCGIDTSVPEEESEICTGSYSEDVKGYPVSIPIVEDFDLNDCLEDNLVDPAEKKFEKLDISLFYTPDNPVNDSTESQMGDILSITSSENSSQDSSQLRYEWKVEAYDGGYTDILGDLYQDKLITGGNLENGVLSGLGLSSLDLKLNLGEKYKKYFDDDVGSFKITVTVRESVFGKMRVGKGETVIKIRSTDKKINVYLTNSTDGIKLKQGESICDKTIASEDKDSYSVCPVIKNQILKLEVNDSEMSDFLWKVNKETFSCNSSVSDECSAGNIIFLPITGNEGQKIEVDLIAKNLSKGENIKLSKSFEVAKPYLRITSVDAGTFWKKLLGNYNNLDGSQSGDYSDFIFETYSGAVAALKAEFYPYWLEKSGINNITWAIDGTEVFDNLNPNEIKFTVEKNLGEIYNIDVNSYYTSSNEIRSILKNGWGVFQSESVGEYLSHSIQGEVISTEAAGSTALKNSGRFLANLISNLPDQVVFLLRTALTIFMVILTAGIALSFSSNFYKNKYE